MTKKRTGRIYTSEFKEQVVQLYLNGKRKCDIKVYWQHLLKKFFVKAVIIMEPVKSRRNCRNKR